MRTGTLNCCNIYGEVLTFKVLTNDAHNGSTCVSVNHSCNVQTRDKDEKKRKMKKREIKIWSTKNFLFNTFYPVCFTRKPFVNIVFHIFQYLVAQKTWLTKKLSLINRKPE